METKIDHIIARVLSGEASFEDLLYLSDWLNKNEKNKNEFSQLKNYWDAEVSFNDMLVPSVSMEKIQQRIREQEKKTKNKLLLRMWIPVAASIAIFVCIAIGYLAHQKIEAPREFYTYLTNNNRTHFALNDGTKISLNKNSKLTYTNTYGTGNRHVRLEGEAYFEVTSDPGNPFQVAIEVGAKDASITVLGTVFGVKIDADEERVIATLVEGSIVFETADQAIKMQPNQQLVYSFTTQNINLSEVNAADEVLWKDGLIKYKTVTLTDLMNELEKRYNTKINIQNRKLRGSSVTVSGTFTEEQSLDQILDVISRSLPIKWSKNEKGYYIR